MVWLAPYPTSSSSSYWRRGALKTSVGSSQRWGRRASWARQSLRSRSATAHLDDGKLDAPHDRVFLPRPGAMQLVP